MTEEREKILKEAIKYIDLGNKLAKIDKEDRAFLYKIKYDFIESIINFYSKVVVSIIPVVNGKNKLIEVNLLENYTFHIPCKDFNKFDSSITPVVYNPSKSAHNYNDLDRDDICRKLFRYYIEFMIGFPTIVKNIKNIYIHSGIIRFWYTKEIVKLEYGKNYDIIRDNGIVNDHDCRNNQIYVILDSNKNEVRKDKFVNIFSWALEFYQKYF